jgi:MSHA biogenesis protein MshN
MSVINQMLKDLDKRQEQSHSNMQSSVPQLPAKNHTSLAVVLTVIVTLVVVALFYLFLENQSLKQVNEKHLSVLPKVATEDVPSTQQSTGQIDTVNQAESQQLTLAQNTPENLVVNSVQTREKSTSKEDLNENVVLNISNDDLVVKNEYKEVITESVEPTELVENRLTVINPPEQAPNKPEVQPSLNISRKKLSPKDLASKKMAQAEQAMLNQNIKEAEQYFEEILLIFPEHQAARKQLAALLYGRQEIQQAVNILAQGVQLTPENPEFRLMQARIYLDKGYQQEALATLKPLSTTLNVEYQSLLATVAQSLKSYDVAKVAYTQLIKIQGNQGRWHLGLAISHDSLGEYQEAYSAYNNAINAYGLSESALSFAKQRKLELGDK